VRRLDRSAVLVTAAYLLFTLNFGAYRVFGDGEQYFSFVQRLFGDRADASGYNFGVGLMNVPFYAAAKLAALVSGISAERATRASVTFASITWVFVAAAATFYLVRKLRLPAATLATAAAVFGTPVWYYASFSPSYSHAADAAAFSVASVCVWKLWSTQSLWWRAGAGAALGLAVAVRPFNAAVVAGAVIALAALRRLRDAGAVAVAAVAAFCALAAIPLALGLSLTQRADGTDVSAGTVGFAPLSPLRMLFTLHRGLFLWTPVAAVAVVGIALLLRRHPARGFLVTLAAMAAGLLLSYVGLVWWDGGWSFSQRLLSAPVPLYGIGVAGVLAAVSNRRRVIASGGVVVLTACSVFLGMSHAFGARQSDGALELAATRGPGSFAHLTWSYSRIRHVVERLHRG
jgi:hypothetical protein